MGGRSSTEESSSSSEETEEEQTCSSTEESSSEETEEDEEQTCSSTEESSSEETEEDEEQTCSVQIEISNGTRDIILENPRSYFPRANCPRPPNPMVPPGSSATVKFSTESSRGCVGVLVYESDAFTLAIYFYNPVRDRLSPREVGLEVSLSKSHLGKLPDVYKHMLGQNICSGMGDTAFHRIRLGDGQETARVTIGPVQVLATMSNSRSSVINVVVRENPQTGREEKSFLQ